MSEGFVQLQQMRSTAIAVGSRSRIPSRFKGHIWKPFASYEAFYDRGNAGGPKTESGLASRCRSRSTCRFSRPTCGKAANGLKDVNYLMFGLIVRTRNKNLINRQHSKRRLPCRKCYNEEPQCLP